MNDFNFNIIYIPIIDSTNSYAHKLLREKKVQESTVIRTDFQEKGKGQLNNKWESEEGKNLLISMILYPNLVVDQQFLISKVVALGVKDYLDSLSAGEVKIKWPNDILIDKKKVAGILIENSIVGKLINTSILGIGLNVNQEEFKSYQREALSLRRIKKREFNLQNVLKELINKIRLRYLQFQSQPDLLEKEYLIGLYGYGTPMKFKDSDGEFTGVIQTVLRNGKLQLNVNGTLKSYELKEIQFID